MSQISDGIQCDTTMALEYVRGRPIYSVFRRHATFPSYCDATIKDASHNLLLRAFEPQCDRQLRQTLPSRPSCPHRPCRVGGQLAGRQTYGEKATNAMVSAWSPHAIAGANRRKRTVSFATDFAREFDNQTRGRLHSSSPNRPKGSSGLRIDVTDETYRNSRRQPRKKTADLPETNAEGRTGQGFNQRNKMKLCCRFTENQKHFFGQFDRVNKLPS
ncbi:MAG: hypothetical protein EOS86_32215 [Mesorhizobium sp.]|nr:MAG: hypothetical protein EOS86_32215 [Mesorhizobium sp.]